MSSDYTIFWMLLGFALIVADLTILPAIGALFAGLGAITTYILLELNFIGHNELIQLLCFILTTLAWTALLWIPIRKFSSSRHKHAYSNMVGDEAVVSETDLIVGGSGNIRWSGVMLKAELLGKNGEKAMVGETVLINSIKGNVVYVSKKE